MDLEQFGVPGLDDIFKGGVQKNSTILVKGPPGVGKTILALQFLCYGAKKGQPGLFISVEEEISVLRERAKIIGLDLEAYEKKKLLFLLRQDVALRKPFTIAEPLKLITKEKIKRVVLDSLTLLHYINDSEIAYRRALLDLLANMNSTLFLSTAEEKKDGVDNIPFTPEDFLFDCVVKLAKIRKGHTFEKCIYALKTRGREHLEDIFPYTITKGGITVYPQEIPFSLIEKDFRDRK